MPEPVQLVVTPEESGMRLDSYLVSHFSKHSRVKLQRAIAAGNVSVDGNSARSSTKLKSDQRVIFTPPEVQSDAPIPENIPITVLFEDDSMVAINKPPRMVVHPAKGNWKGTLTSALAYHFNQLSSVGGDTRPGIVHRLDRDTSGVILVAKTDEAHRALASQFEKRTVEKEYFTIVTPAPDRDRDIIDKPIGAHPYQREKKAIRENHSTSRDAKSFYEVIKRYRGFATVKVKPKTGRTHQIRVHMGHIGCPVLCDKLYSGRATINRKQLDPRCEEDVILLDRQALHARTISFDHPESGERMTLSADLPSDIRQTIEMIKQTRS
jgi:23S rRNA pseudouridine1911/1915/1917 synthase